MIATMDTKGHEAAFVAAAIREAGAPATLVDVGTLSKADPEPDITRETVAALHPRGAEFVLGHTDRGQAVTAIGEALVAFLRREMAMGRLAGAIGLGGTGGTALIAPALRALPIGVPKLIVSTVASGNTAPYVGASDTLLCPSVVDVAGLNSVSRPILSNAAHAIAGMVLHRKVDGGQRPVVGMTMFGVTTPCVTAVRQQLERDGYDCLVFHATGTGGRAMEQLVETGVLGGVLDITTTEVADEVVGGVFPAGPKRFDAIIARGVPYVMSLGALDMVNFGAADTVPAKFKGRKLHVHNAQVTLMRTTPEENRQFGAWMAAKINRSTAPLILLIPEKGVSLLDAPNLPFHDPEADRALFETLERQVRQTATRQIRRLPLHLNDPAFAAALVEAFEEVKRLAGEAVRPTNDPNAA